MFFNTFWNYTYIQKWDNPRTKPTIITGLIRMNKHKINFFDVLSPPRAMPLGPRKGSCPYTPPGGLPRGTMYPGAMPPNPHIPEFIFIILSVHPALSISDIKQNSSCLDSNTNYIKNMLIRLKSPTTVRVKESGVSNFNN